MKTRSHNQSGFTVVELMIATVIFALILLLCATATIQIGRYFHKGYTSSRAQESAREVTSEIVQSVQFGAGEPIVVVDSYTRNGLKHSYICINTLRYTYGLDAQVTDGITGYNADGKHQAPHALWREPLDSPADCFNGLADLTQAQPTAVSGARELIPQGMRLKDFAFTKEADGFWKIVITVIAGHDDVIERETTAPYRLKGCLSTARGGQFCSVSSLQTTAFRRLR
jgi:prepilin-type N-terminal cleavage/methylation domain-containing protein